MPNRFIKDSVCTSENLDKLSPMAECLFYRLLVTVDDFGCYYGNPTIIKSNCFPLKSDVIKSEQVKAWVDELISADLIREYVCKEDGRHYIQFTKWKKHQNTRAQKPKYPLPEDNCEQMQADANNCEQMQADVPDIRIRNSLFDIRNSYSKTNTEPAPIQRDEGFESFWDAYPKKTGDIRQAYQEYVIALDTATSDQLLTALQSQVEASSEKDLQYFPSADKWLRNRSWLKPTKAKKPPRTFDKTEFD